MKIMNYRKIIILLLCLSTFFSCSEILIEQDISEEEVELVAPFDNAQFVTTGITFSWNSVQDATEYQIQIAKPNFSNPLQIVLDTIVSSTSFTQQLPVGQYEWRVRALNGSYRTAFSKRSVTVASNEDFQSNTVLLTSPANNLITKTPTQSLSWQSIIGATNYQLQVFDSSSTLLLDVNTANTSYNYTFPEGSFQWKVRATNGTDYTLYSARSILVDITPPNTPTLSTPANLSSTTVTDISFQWTRTPISGSTERDSIYIYTDNALTILDSKAQATSPFSKTLSEGTYYWRVKAFDTAGNVGSVSSTFSFTID